VFAILQLGTPVTSTSFPDNRLFLLLYPVLVLLGGIGAYGIATRAMRPVRRVTQAAQQIALGDLQQRVPVPISRDDVHTLALTFNEMAAKLDAAFAQQRRFVADASHELRTPVAVIRSMTDVALAGVPSAEDYQTTLREVNAEAERLGRLINTLLGLARVDDGRQPQDHEIVRLDLLVTDLADSVAPLAHEHGLTLALVRNDPAQITGDTAQIIQILMSLTENAINYTASGGHINLSVAVEGAAAKVHVSDTGMGIDPKDLPHIFERFYRADPARSRVAGGNGLGLALAREFALAHGGDITVLSRVSQGSTFTVTLPLLREQVTGKMAP
ncbi:MAG: HAMP domain-containing histidine kinase, partial [Ktedonobacterales bacterium]|nr:HAMP domain-containing histidine kinase [Ktedonobacterales bacterium]